MAAAQLFSADFGSSESLNESAEKERERKRERKKELSANYERTNSAKEQFGEKGLITNVKERMVREKRKKKV